MPIKVEIIIDDPAQIAGVEYARDLYNEGRPNEKLLSSEDYAARMKEAGL